MSDKPRWKEPNYQRIALYLVLANAVLTVLVLVSPFGIGDGSGVIGYSVPRMLVMALIQAPIALGGIIASIASLRHGLKWLPGFVLHIIVFSAAFFLYFTQTGKIEQFLRQFF